MPLCGICSSNQFSNMKASNYISENLLHPFHPCSILRLNNKSESEFSLFYQEHCRNRTLPFFIAWLNGLFTVDEHTTAAASIKI